MVFNTIFTKNNNITVREAAALAEGGEPIDMVLPLTFLFSNKREWKFPVEPLISISGKNVIVRRNVAKSELRGSVKERWAEDDFQIHIQGSLVHPDLHTYPSDELSMLHQAITQREAIGVKNELLALLNIGHIVVENYSFPFSKGENVQNFSIDAYSDDITELFIDVRNV